MKFERHRFHADSRRALIPLVSAILAGAALLVSLPARAAMPCAMAAECASGFCVDGFCCNTACTGDCQACSAAKKGGGTDGECGLAAAGTVCKAGYCDGASFSFIDEAKCNSVGTCAEPKPIPCLSDNPCVFDLCSDTGCEQSVKLDGTDCGGGMQCLNGVCGMGSASSSSSSSSGAGGGSGGAGGAGGIGGTGGAGVGGDGETGGSSSSGQFDPYPPSREQPGCSCSITGNRFSGTTAWFVAAAAVGWRRWRRAERPSSKSK